MVASAIGIRSQHYCKLVANRLDLQMLIISQDPLISPYIARVLPSVQQMLNTTKQRMSIIPGGPVDTARSISDIQDILSRKPMYDIRVS